MLVKVQSQNSQKPETVLNDKLKKLKTKGNSFG